MYTHKILNIASRNRPLSLKMSEELGISGILAQLLINRGIENSAEAALFLNPDPKDLLDPFLFCDMPKAVEIIRRAARNKEKVMVFSDYDVDGLTSLTLLEEKLTGLGLRVTHYIPNRVKEGYGLNSNILRIVKEEGIKVLITADCGTNSDEEIRELRRLGVEVIITDHHEPTHQGQEIAAQAVINPKMNNSGYGYRYLAGVGVAYKLCQAITGELLDEDLDLVALGTVADSVPLTGENRIITKAGLVKLTHTRRTGLAVLMEASGIKNKKITPGYVSYIIGPRINASGRVDTAEVALDLLMSEHRQEAEKLVTLIQSHNRTRQKIESAILEEAGDLIDKEVNFKEHKIMVVAKEGWHAGVLGIVAAKLTEKFCRPTILISLGEEVCKGSGRSVKNFHLFEAILECKDLLEGFGGHQHATGLSIARGNIADFRDKINHLAREKLRLEDLLPSLDIDMELPLSALENGFIKEIALLEPFGMGNPQPLFYTRNLKIKGEPRVLARETLKFWVTDGRVTCQAIGFGIRRLKESLQEADLFDLVYSPQIDAWGGEESLILEVKEIFFK